MWNKFYQNLFRYASFTEKENMEYPHATCCSIMLEKKKLNLQHVPGFQQVKELDFLTFPADF